MVLVGGEAAGTGGGLGTGRVVLLLLSVGVAVALVSFLAGRATKPSMMWMTPFWAYRSPSTTPASPTRVWPAAPADGGSRTGELSCAAYF